MTSITARLPSMTIRRGTTIAATMVLLLTVLTACDTLSEDLSSLGGSLNQPSPGEAARWMVDPNDADKRRRGTVLISTSVLGPVPANVAWYRDRVLNERDPMVLATAITALARHGEPSDARLIAPHLNDEAMQVRWAAARGLQRLHEPEVIGPLLETLRDEDESMDVRVSAARALGQYPGDRTFQGLIAALNQRELAVNLAANESLQTLTGRDFGLNSTAWQQWYDEPENGPGGAFANAETYEYHVYSRDISWVEYIVFWTIPTFETPAPPAGLRPDDERRTYDDSAPLSEGS